MLPRQLQRWGVWGVCVCARVCVFLVQYACVSDTYSASVYMTCEREGSARGNE